MIKKIVCASFFFFALIALMLALAGVKEANLSSPFMSFLINCNKELNDFKIEIPDIKPFKPIDETNPMVINNAWDAIRYAWATMVSTLNLEGLVNGIIGFINFLTTIINSIVQLIQLIFIILKNLIIMKDSILNDSGTILVQ